MKPSSARWLFLFVLMAFTAAGAGAQGITTSALTGRVVDENDDPLPGANVIAVHQPTGVEYGTVTRTDGAFSLLNLQSGGPYTVTASFVGFQSAREEGIQLALGQTRSMQFQLREATAELAEVQVIGEANTILNSERTGASTNIGRETIERLPTINRTLGDFARLTPQGSTRGDATSLGGRNNRYNNIQIDGATLNDVFGLSDTGAPGGQAGAQPISLDAIQEFNVDIAPYDIRYNGFTGGSINAVTRSGTNRLSGSFRYLTRNESFVGSLKTSDGANDTFGDFSESYIVGTLGGPIIKNKLFFFANAEFEDETTPLNAGIRGSGQANIFPVGADTLNQIIGIARNKYGYDPGSFDPISDGQGNLKLLGKLDWIINNNHRATLRYNLVDAQDDDGISRSNRNYDFGNRRFIRDEVTNSAVAELRSTLGPNMYNEARLVYTQINFERTVEADPFPYVNVDVTRDYATYMGIDRFSQANALDQKLWEFTNDFNLISGKHSLTFGTSNQLWSFNNVFIQDYYGAYEFDSVADFEAGKASRYYLSYSLLPDELKPAAEFSTLQVGFYGQDKIAVTPHLSVTAGLRVDAPFYLDDPLYNPAAEAAFGIDNTKLPSGSLLWSPRLGFNWDASGGARTTQLRGGTGIFSGRTPYVWISNQFSNSGMDIARVDKRNLPAGCFVASPDPAQQPRPGTALGTQCGLSAITTAEINVVEEDFKNPQVWRTNLAVDQQLPWGVIGTLEGIYTKSLNEVSYQNLNLVQTGTSAYGRPIYGTASYNGSSKLKDSRFTNALLLKNTNEGYEYSLTGMLRKQAGGLDAMAAYTYNQAENVNNATSSRAISNWQYNENFDVNGVELARADWEVRHRIIGSLAYRLDYANRFATTLGLVYEGRSGTPFSWVYNGNANADTRRDNDLIYVPASASEIDLKTNNWDALNQFIEDNKDLREARGGVVQRNSANAPWRNILDLNVTQQIETLRGQRIEVMANVLNVLNLLDKEWGLIKYPSNDAVQILNFDGYTTDGKPIVSFDPAKTSDSALYTRANLASRWQLQLGVRYVF